MSTSAPAPTPDPNDPRLTTIPQDIEPPAPIQSPQALRLLSYSLTAKARALEDCEQFVYVYRCPNGHVWPAPITCHQRFCPNCAERIALRMVKKYDAIEIGEAPFLFIALSAYAHNGDISRGMVMAIGREIGKGFKLLERSTEAPIGAIWNLVPSDGGKLTAYLLLWGDGTKSLDRYREAWPKMAIKISSRPAHQFHQSLHQVFEHAPSKNPLFRADCENAFHGRRSVHTMGRLHLKPQAVLDPPRSKEGVDELFPSEQETGNNTPTCKGHRCPRCQAPACGVTIRMSGVAFRHPTLGYRWWDNYKGA